MESPEFTGMYLNNYDLATTSTPILPLHISAHVSVRAEFCSRCSAMYTSLHLSAKPKHFRSQHFFQLRSASDRMDPFISSFHCQLFSLYLATKASSFFSYHLPSETLGLSRNLSYLVLLPSPLCILPRLDFVQCLIFVCLSGRDLLTL